MKTKILVLLTSLIMIATCLSLSGCSMCDHVFENQVVAPTCTQKGYTMRTCTLCSIIITDDYVPATGHVYSGEGVVVRPTCDQDGYTQYRCSSCGENVQTDIVNALGHNYSIVQQINLPTCTETGLSEYACSRCGKHENKTEAALGHDYVTIYEEEGYQLSACTRCGDEVNGLVTYTIRYELNGGSAENPTEYTVLTETFSLQAPTKGDAVFLGWTWEGQLLPVKDVTIEKGSKGNRVYVANWYVGECTYHVLNGEYVVDKVLDSSTPGVIEFSDSVATCLSNGKGMFTCETCAKKVFTETKKAHKFNFNDVKEYISEPTCETNGRGMLYCSTCRQTLEADIPAYGHDFESELITKDGKAVLVLTCKICEKVEERVIEKCSDYVPATCVSEGSITYSCVIEDGKTLSVTLKIEKTSHVLNGVRVGDSIHADTKGLVEFGGLEATCATNGKGMFTCEYCDGKIFTVTHRDHTLLEDTVEVIEQATCDKAGKIKGVCSECKLDVESEIPATGHDCKYTVKTKASILEVGVVTVTCQKDDCNFVIECYLPKLNSDIYKKTRLEDGRIKYAYNLYEYGITVYFIV